MNTIEQLKYDFEQQWTSPKTTETKVEEEAEDNEHKVPMPSDKNVLNDRGIEFRMLAKVSANSKHKKGEEHNYIMKSDIDFNEIAKEFCLAKETIRKMFTKLKKADSKVIEAINTSDGVAYKINYKTDGKYFVTIHHQMLNELAISTNSNIIRLYIVMCVQLKNGKKQLTEEWLSEQLELSRQSIAIMIGSLVKLGFINQYKHSYTVIDGRGIEINRNGYKYELCSVEEWQQTLTNRIKN